MTRTEAIEWLKSIKTKYIHGGDDFYDYERKTAIDYAVYFLEGEKLMTNADRIRAMTDEELADMRVRYNPVTMMYINDTGEAYYDFVSAMEAELEWLQQPAEGD